MAPLQSGSGLISVVPDTTEVQANTRSLGCHQKPGADMRVILQLGHIDLSGLHCHKDAMLMSGPRLLLKAGSELMSMAPDTIKGNANASGLGHHIRPCLCLRTTMLI